MLNSTLECHMTRPHAFSHKVSTYIYIYIYWYWLGGITLSRVTLDVT